MRKKTLKRKREQEKSMKWTQVRVRCATGELDTVSAILSVIDSGLMIEDYSDIEENLMTVYGELIDEKS